MAWNQRSYGAQRTAADNVLDSLPGTYTPICRAGVKQHVDAVLSQIVSLKVRAGTLAHGGQQRLLQLHGTVPIFYKAVQYNIPVSIWCPANYPNVPPLCFVTPTPEMRVKPDHKHVDQKGLVYLPYLNQWSSSSTLLDLINFMSSVFSDDPPVFRYDPREAQLQQALEESKRLAEQPRNVQNDAASKKEAVLERVSERIKSHLREFYDVSTQEVDGLFASQAKLVAGQNTIALLQEQLRKEKRDIQTAMDQIAAATEASEEWVAKNESKELDVDSVVRPRDTWSRQLLKCVAGDHAVDDTIYALNQALQRERIDITEHLKQTRRLARQQFMDRALASKIINEQYQRRNTIAQI